MFLLCSHFIRLSLYYLQYQNLPEAYSWTQRHTESSWRERYKRNKARLDPIIDDYVKKNTPNPKSTYAYSRSAYIESQKEEEEEEEYMGDAMEADQGEEAVAAQGSSDDEGTANWGSEDQLDEVMRQNDEEQE